MPSSRRSRAIVTALVVAGAITSLAGPSVVGGASPAPSVMPVLPGEEWILYQWYGLHLVRPDGTDDHVIAPEFLDPGKDPNLQGAYNPAWSPDGTQILFLDSVHEGWPIMIADADGTGAHQVVPCGEGCQVLDAPAWSPDGRSIAYARFEGEWPPDAYTSRYSIEVMDLATGVKRTVVAFLATPGEPATMYDDPRWSPDGKSLVITVDQLDGTQLNRTGTALAIVDAQGPGPATPRILTDWDLWATYPDWSPTQDLIVFHSNRWPEEPSNLYTIHPDGTGLTQLTTFAPAGERATQPTWTPDGERIIFTHIDRDPNGGDGGAREAAFIDADGKDMEILHGFMATHPRLRPVP